MADDRPSIVRPIPRRPFDLNLNLNLTSPTPPSEDSTSPSPNPADSESSNLLPPKQQQTGYVPATPSESAGTISRSQSILNLTSSTLFGIYSPSSSRKDRFEREELDTPWGTGAQTPVKHRQSVDGPTFELMKDRSTLLSRRRSSRPTPPRPSAAASVLSLVSRVGLLFLLGMGYGALVTRFPNGERLAALSMESVLRTPSYDFASLAVWGVSGVLLGALLPWFDGVWADMFGADSGIADDDEDVDDDEARRGTDWALVVRSIGAFVGIVFAIRKLPWASTLQVSLTLALVNPFLWYLIDRSKPGFLLSAAVGLAGSALLMGIDPGVMPTPSALPYRSGLAGGDQGEDDRLMLGGLASQGTLETGVWSLSVLFCSCVCFGNIGRRLALSGPSAMRGRWAGVKSG